MPEALARLASAWMPSPATVAVVAPLSAVCSAAAAALVGRLRTRQGIRTPYTRKIFHFLIFTAAGGAHLAWGRPGAVVFGTVVAGWVLHAVWRGDGHAFYEALARPSDAPRRGLFVVVPLGATAVGGVAANLLFPVHAVVGYLVCGWGDAVGEPVGVRWGRHPYRVPTLAGVPAERTLEGSAAVAGAGALAAAAGLWLSGRPPGTAASVGLACGAVGAAVEAASHHGLDNVTIQVAAAATASALI